MKNYDKEISEFCDKENQNSGCKIFDCCDGCVSLRCFKAGLSVYDSEPKTTPLTSASDIYINKAIDSLGMPSIEEVFNLIHDRIKGIELI